MYYMPIHLITIMEDATHLPLAAKISMISKNLLQCAICHEQFQDPRALPCQHGFCRECLAAWAKRSTVEGKLGCPTCREEVSLPNEGVNGLPVHFLVSSLKDICEDEKQVACSNCDKPGKKANFHCFDCKEYLCDECLAHHKGLKLTKHHKVVTVEDLLSGKVSDEGRYCKIHGELVRYYCDTEDKQVCTDCISLKTCPIEHERTSLKDASHKQTSAIEKLVKECEDTKKEFEGALLKTEEISKDFEKAKEEARSHLDKVKREYMQKIEEFFLKHKAEITRVDLERTKEIGDRKDQLEKHIVEIEKACKLCREVIQSGSNYEITSSYGSLVGYLENLKQKPVPASDTLRYLKLQKFSPLLLSWKFTGQVQITKNANCIAVNQEGDIAFTSYGNHVRVFTRTGQCKHTFTFSPYYVGDIAVKSNNYIINVDGRSSFLCCDIKGNILKKKPGYDMNYKPSKPYGVAVDMTGRIILGLENNIISIYSAEETLLSSFATHADACHLAVTATEGLVVCFEDNTLKLMDYSGNNVRNIQPPDDVVTWKPTYICTCHKYDEVFVVNDGDPKAVYSYSSDGEYLECVTKEVMKPAGIAVSKDEQELFVADGSEIKIFQRSVKAE